MSFSLQAASERRKSLFTRNFVLLILANFLMATSFYFLIPTLPIYFETYLGADKSSTGTVLAMFAIAALVIRPFAGFGLDRFGRRLIYLASLLFLSLLFPFYGFVYTLGLMAAFRFSAWPCMGCHFYSRCYRGG
jgi:MFS family permease